MLLVLRLYLASGSIEREHVLLGLRLRTLRGVTSVTWRRSGRTRPLSWPLSSNSQCIDGHSEGKLRIGFVENGRSTWASISLFALARAGAPVNTATTVSLPRDSTCRCEGRSRGLNLRRLEPLCFPPSPTPYLAHRPSRDLGGTVSADGTICSN